MKNLREEMINEAGKSILRPLGKIQLLFWLILISSPFVWIWFSGYAAIKVGLTGFGGALIISLIYHLLKNMIEKEVDEFMDNNKMR